MQLTPFIRTFELQTFKDVNVQSHALLHELVPMSGIHCHLRALSTSGCVFTYFTVQYCIESSSIASLFQAQDVLKHHKCIGDIADTTKKCQAMETKVKIFERMEQ